MLVLTKRQNNILIFLTTLNNSIKIEQLAEKFKVSSRTIRNELHVIDGFLNEYKIKIIRKPSVGIYLEKDKDNFIKLRNDLNLIDYRILDFEERNIVISLLILCNKKITFDKLANICLISKQTVINSFKSIEKYFLDYGVNIIKSQGKGITVYSNQESILNLFENILETTYKNELIMNLLFKNSEIYKFDADASLILNNLSKEKNVYFSNEDKIKILLKFIIFRFVDDFTINKTNNKIYPSYFSEENINKIEKLMEKYVVINNSKSLEYKVAVYLIEKLDKINKIDKINKEYFINGLTNHLRLAIYREKNNIKIENELLSQIKIRIPLIFEFTKRELLMCEALDGIIFSENEIAYISMYLASAYEKSINLYSKLNILLVCSFGLATSTILKTRILKIIQDCNIIGPLSESEAKTYINKNKVDLIICTGNCFIEDIELISVNPLIDTSDIEIIKNKLFQISYTKSCENFISGYVKNNELNKKTYIKDLLVYDCIQIIDEIDDWEIAIQTSAKPLIKKGLIENRYVTKMIDAVKQFGTYMVLVEETAFVHAGVDDGIKDDCTSILILRKPVTFGYKNPKSVRNIVILGIKNKINNPLIDLIYIFEKEDNLKRLKEKSIDIDEIYLMHN
ncbi:MAG: PTS sugar transporter subunit IIA [Erysipelotrichaceae bacterium]|nr:PTS sugar transporter subunit IIA [Erysipelotrichaceae bacterium]